MLLVCVLTHRTQRSPKTFHPILYCCVNSNRVYQEEPVSGSHVGNVCPAV